MIEIKSDGIYVDGVLKEDFNDGYYHVSKDMYDYPDAKIIVAFSRRGPGKTTGALLSSYYKGECVFYLKRTIQDVKTILTSEEDLSPWKTIARLTGKNFVVNKFKGVEGLAVVQEADKNGNPITTKKPVGYIAALAASGKIKGFDLSSEVDVVILDEYVASTGVIVRQAEGFMFVDILATLYRDRHLRNLPELKILLFSNCDALVSPVGRTLDILDNLYDLCASGDNIMYVKDRKILIHHILPYEFSTTVQSSMFDFMRGTEWYSRNIEGKITEDMSSICKTKSLKAHKCVGTLSYNNKTIYVLYRESDSSYYLTYDYCMRIGQVPIYDMGIEADVRLFYVSKLFASLLEMSMLRKTQYSNYSIYDLVKRYSDIFSSMLY